MGYFNEIMNIKAHMPSSIMEGTMRTEDDGLNNRNQLPVHWLSG